MRRISIFLGVAAAIHAASAGAEPLQEAKWLAADAQRVAALTQSPGECAGRIRDPETAYLAEIGRAAFSSPLLLGGQAARGGLSCASCHTDGHSNPGFFLEGLSGAAGTADVSSSIFSKVRDDGVFNPVAIPALVGITEKQSFGTTSPAPSLRAFIRSAVADEFQGDATPSAVIDGLVAYIGSLDAASCPSAPVAFSPRRAMRDVERTLAIARRAAERGDRETVDFLLVSAQAALGRIDDRFPAQKAPVLRKSLAELSVEAGAWRNFRGETATIVAALDEIEGRAKKLGKRLQAARHQSLYDAEMLARHLEGE